MKPAKILPLAALILIFAFSTLLYANVPQMINYQGKITTPAGALVDTTVAMVFTIYDDSTAGSTLWTETQASVGVEKGIFSVLLGSVNPIPDSVFDGSTRYLGVKVGDDDEMSPRKAIVSVAYAYRAATVQSGGVDCSDCDDRFVNVQGPDSVVAGSGAAFSGKVIASTELPVYGIKGYAYNDDTATGDAYGGHFSTSPFGLGIHYGIKAEGHSSSVHHTYGAYGYAANATSGPTFGGYFKTDSSGTGYHYGVRGEGYGNSSSRTIGSFGYAKNTSSGYVHGGWFWADCAGTGHRYGVYGEACSNSSAPAYGLYGYAKNTSTGQAIAGNFYTYPDGEERHFGVRATSFANYSLATYGVYGSAQNDSSGNVYAGYFYASDFGSGTKYAVWAYAPVDKGYAGYFEGDVRITDSLVVLGGKSAAVKVDNGDYHLLYSQESTENWFEDFGEAQLVNGRAHIELDPLFLQTVTINDLHPMKVFIQLRDECKGTYVKTLNTGFDVFELQGGTSNAPFSYRIVAKRKGFENIRLAKMGGPTPQEVTAEQAELRTNLEEERIMMEQERQKMEEEKAKMDIEGELR